MDKSKTTNILLIIIISLLALQIFITGELSSDLKKYEKEKMGPGLPEGLNSDAQREALFNTFKENYNNKDYDALYNWFDEAVRMEYSKEKVMQTVDMLHNNVGIIESGFFSHFEPVPAGYGIKSYALMYTIKTTKGIATLKINIMQQGNNKYKNYGFTIVSK